MYVSVIKYDYQINEGCLEELSVVKTMEIERIYNPHVSVDCAVFGFDGTNLQILLAERKLDGLCGLYNDKKLPGSIILADENLDEAANRILKEYTGLSDIYLKQFQAFGNPNRSTALDIMWLEKTAKHTIARIVTVGYLALIKIDDKIKLAQDTDTSVVWLDVNELPDIQIAFDHREIIASALDNIRRTFKFEPHLMFELLPKKFTMSQLRTLYDRIYQTRSDVRNFQKKMMQLNGLVMLDETETGVPHRAARYFTYKKRGV